MFGSSLERNGEIVTKVELEFDGFNLKDFKLKPIKEGKYVWNDDCTSGVTLISKEELETVKVNILEQLKYKMNNKHYLSWACPNRILSGEDSYTDRMIASYQIENGSIKGIQIFNNFSRNNQLIDFIEILYDPTRIYYWLNMFYDD